MIGYSIPSLAVSRFWFQEAGMITPCNEYVAPKVYLVPIIPGFDLTAYTDSLLLPVERWYKKLQKRFIRERILT